MSFPTDLQKTGLVPSEMGSHVRFEPQIDGLCLGFELTPPHAVWRADSRGLGGCQETVRGDPQGSGQTLTCREAGWLKECH